MKKLTTLFLSLALLISLVACTSTEVEDDTFKEMPQPFEQDGGDAHRYYLQCGVYRFDDVSSFFWDNYSEYLSGKELISEWGEYEGSIIPYMTGIMTYPNIYSLAVMNDIPIEIVIAAIDEHNAFYSDLIMRNEAGRYLPSEDKYYLLYSEDDKAVLLTCDEEKITAHFATEQSIVIGNKIYTPAWLYTHTPEDYKIASITPEMISEKLTLYNEFAFTEEARTAFETKLSKFVGQNIIFENVNVESFS